MTEGEMGWTRLERFTSGLLGLLVLFVPCVYGQTAQGSSSGTQSAQQASKGASSVPTLIENADEVSLDMTAHDKRSRVILDLTPADIEVTDNGIPVTLKGLHLVSGPSDTEHSITMVFDPMDGAKAHIAHEIADKILKMAPKTRYNLAVLSVGSRLRLIQGFTSDSKALEKAVAEATEEGEVQRSIAIAAAEKSSISIAQTGVDPSGTMVDISGRAQARELMAALEGSQQIVQDQHTEASLAGLLSLAYSLRSMPGRKTVIYFAGNGADGFDSPEMVQTIIGAANRANLSVYTVDMKNAGIQVHDQLMSMMVMGNMAGVNPISTPGQGQAGDPAGPGAGTFIANNSSRFEGAGLDANRSPLAKLASGTGGAYIFGQDSVKKPLAQMLQDMTTYYEASYVPPEQEFDGSFRPISVKARRAGLDIRSRSGYFSLPSGGIDGVRPFETPLLKILSGAPLPTDLSLHASILKLGDLSNGNTSTLVIEVPLSELELKEDSSTNLYSAHLSILAQVKDKDGVVVERFAEDIPRHGALQSIEAARTETITLQKHFTAVPGDYVLEAATIDQISGRAGAEQIKFEIPQPARGPSLSDLVLVGRMRSYQSDNDSGEPLRYENSVVTPNLSGLVPGNPDSISVFFYLHPDPGISDAPVLEMEVLRDGRAVGHSPLPLLRGKTGGAVPYLATVRASSLSAGLYTIKTVLTQGDKKIEGHLTLTLRGKTEPGAVRSDASAAAVDDDSKFAVSSQKALNFDELSIMVPNSAVSPPSSDELEAIIADARKGSLFYGEGLPNFMCLEVTRRWVDPNGSGSRGKVKDTLVELMTYRNAAEVRTLLEVNGKRIDKQSEGLKGMRSVGEFGGVLKAVFEPTAKTAFQWRQTAAIGNATVQIFDYRVAHANSSFKITGAGDEQVTVAFHGQIFIDSATHGVRRITLSADDLPKDFSVHATSLAVDYGYVVINGHDYLMPGSAEISLRQSRRSVVVNDIEFRDYRRFGSTVRMVGFTSLDNR